MGQIQLLKSTDSAGQGWFSNSSAPGPLPYAPTTGEQEEGGQDQAAAWLGEAVRQLLSLAVIADPVRYGQVGAGYSAQLRWIPK